MEGANIYSGSVSVIDSNKNFLFQRNRYTACEASNATWTFDNHAYDMFDEYRAATG